MKISKIEILNTSRTLFNQRGLTAVTVRIISAELKISPGSFSYHFPDKRRIITELYRTMASEMQECMKSLDNEKIGITTFLSTFEKFAFVQLKYKFFFLNLFDILSDFPAIKQLHLKALTRERAQSKELFTTYKRNGVFTDAATEKELKSILRLSQILFAYWVIDAELKNFESERQKVRFYAQVCSAPIQPFLSENSKTEYQDYFKLQEMKPIN